MRAFADWIIHEANQKGVFQGSVVVAPPRNDDLIPAINRQDGMFTLYLRGLREGQTVDRRQVVSSISRAISPREEWKEMLRLAAGEELRFIISNTTEAGINYHPQAYPADKCPASFPAMLTMLLYHRYLNVAGYSSAAAHEQNNDNPSFEETADSSHSSRHLSSKDSSPEKGLIILPCELIAQNGTRLREMVQLHADDWSLPESFKQWLVADNYFLNTLVDRIVTGFPAAEREEAFRELGYRDELINAAEPFHSWVIEAPPEVSSEFPLQDAGLNIKWVEDLEPYRQCKVRLLNGAHTSLAPVALLQGVETVREAVEDPLTGSFLQDLFFEEIIPSLEEGVDGTCPSPGRAELEQFAGQVLERFRNPFINHYWQDISINSVSKFRERALPSILEYHSRWGMLPRRLVFALAALLALYRGGKEPPGERGMYAPAAGIYLRDDPEVLQFFYRLWKEFNEDDIPELLPLVQKALQQEKFWGKDLSRVPGLVGETVRYLEKILREGPRLLLEERGGFHQ